MKTRVVHILLLFLSVCELAGGQNKISGYSVNPKVGAFNWLSINVGLVRGIELNMLRNNNIFSLDYYNCIIILDIPTNNQVDFMLGKYFGEKYFRFQLQGGLGTAWGIKKGERIGSGIPYRYEQDRFFTLGVPVKLGFKIMPASFLSIGADLQANLNFKYPIYMTMFSIEIGKIRNRIK